MQSLRGSIMASCVWVVLVVVGGSACADGTERPHNAALTMAVDTASSAIVGQLRAGNGEAYLGEEASSMETLDGIDATAEARAALDEEVAKIRTIAQESAPGEATARQVDAVDVRTYGEPEWGSPADGKVSVTVDVLVSRHFPADDVDSAEIIPHELTLDAETGKILEIVVQDLDYQIAQKASHS